MMVRSTYLALSSIILALSSGLVNIASADYSIPVSHAHNGREHNHQLPKEGVNHRHGIGQLGKAIRKQNTVIYSNTRRIPNPPKTTYKPPKPTSSNNSNANYDNRAHTHAGREHIHPLPNQGVFHRHGVNGKIGQRIANNNATVIYNDTVTYNDTRNFPELDSQANNNNQRNNANNDQTVINQTRRSDRRKWKFGQNKRSVNFTKGSTRCASGENDCNVCAFNVQQQFQKAAAKQVNWSRKRWDFAWPKQYPPQNVRPLDIFDGDPKYALGIPNTHVQGFVKTNSRKFPYAGSHSHKRNGGIFVIGQGKNSQALSSLHKTKSRHPSGVAVIGRYLIWGEGSRLFFKDINSRHQSNDFSLSAPGANFGGGLSIVKLGENNHLLVTTGPGGQKAGPRINRFYHLKSKRGRSSSIAFVNQSATTKPQQWPNIFAYSENMSLITECDTGDIYSVHTTGDEQGISAIAGKGYWRLSKLVSKGKVLGLTAINAFTSRQDMKRCNVRASATVSVNKQNRLEFLCHGYAKDPDGSGFNVLGKSSRNKDKFYYNVGIVR